MATAIPVPVPVADGLCRETRALGRQMDFFNPCAAGASVPFPRPASSEVVQGDTAVVPNGELFILQEKESPTLQQELMDTKQALAVANQDREKLLQEIRKYNPLFEL